MEACEIETRSEHRCFGGVQGYYTHKSVQTGTRMNFAVFRPPSSEKRKFPALYFLAGLTCTDETFMIKGGAQRLAASLGLMLVTCDTSPRGLGHAGEGDAWDFGLGAGFYVDATESPWSEGYRMASYVNAELPDLVERHFPAETDRRGIFGHSMGGHGALITAMRHPTRWQSISAIAPICNPVAVPWGQKAFEKYLGTDRNRWADWDASLLMSLKSHPSKILVDQGDADAFLESQLRPEALEDAAANSGQRLVMRSHAGYDHGYFFIQSVIESHLEHHRLILHR